MQKSRNINIDIVKGLAILLMVLGHSGAKYTNYIYLFHMAVFFMCTGYCWNNKYIEDGKKLGGYIVSKIKTLWLPYVLCNIFFLLMNNIFIKCNIYTDNPYFLEIVREHLRGYDILHSVLGFKDILIGTIKIMVFAGTQELAGATWFLRVLFCICVGHAIVMYICRKINFRWGAYFMFLLCVIAAGVVDYYKFALPLNLQCCFSAYVAFAMGMFLKEWKIMERLERYSPWICVIPAVIALGVIGQFGEISLGSGSIINVPVYLLASLSGWILLWEIGQIIKADSVKKIIAELGKRTLPIVMFHFLAFKIVSFLYIEITGAEKLLLATYPVIERNGLWTAYLIVGTIVPVVVYDLYKILKWKLVEKRG